MRADAAANRQSILDAGWRLFSERGEDASMRAVAAEAGVGIGTLFRHFETRDELLAGVLNEVLDRIGALLDEAVEMWDSGPAEAWVEFVRSLAELEVGALAYEIGPYVFRTGIMRKQETQRFLAAERLRLIIRHANEAGLVRDDIDEYHLFAGVAAMSRPLPSHIRGLLPDMQEWMVGVFVRGVAP